MNTDLYIGLVYKNLKGELSPQEFDKLNVETATHAHLAKLRIEIEDSWDATGVVKNVSTIKETNDLFEKLVSNKTIKSKKQNRTKIFNIRRLSLAAAALLTLALSAIWLISDKIQTYHEPGEYTLADNSKVTLRSGSELVVYAFNNGNRKVELKGEAYFDIAKDKSRPFSITTSNVKIEVLGTQFLVKNLKDQTYIDLIEGSISTLDTRSLATKTLTKGMQVLHTKDGKIELISQFNNLAAWKDGIFEYRNTSLSQVLTELELVFDIQLKIENDQMKDCLVNGILSGKSLEDIVMRITSKHQMTLNKSNAKWILIGGKCN